MRYRRAICLARARILGSNGRSTSFFAARLVDLFAIAGFDLVVMHWNRQRPSAFFGENMVRTGNSHQPPPVLFKLTPDGSEAVLKLESEGLISVVLLPTPRGLAVAQRRAGRN